MGMYNLTFGFPSAAAIVARGQSSIFLFGNRERDDTILLLLYLKTMSRFPLQRSCQRQGLLQASASVALARPLPGLSLTQMGQRLCLVFTLGPLRSIRPPLLSPPTAVLLTVVWPLLLQVPKDHLLPGLSSELAWFCGLASRSRAAPRHLWS